MAEISGAPTRLTGQNASTLRTKVQDNGVDPAECGESVRAAAKTTPNVRNAEGEGTMKGIYTRVSLACLLGLTLFLANSCIYISGCDWSTMAKYERQVELSAALEPGSTFSAATQDGSITLEGTQSAECKLLATIRTRASTEEEAQELGEQIQVKLESVAGGLTVVIEKPSFIRNAHYGVSLTGTVPIQTHLALTTSDGSVHLDTIEGTIDAKTSDGSIQAEGIKGDTKLKTFDGSIHCARIEAETLDLHTRDGSIKLEETETTSCTAHTLDGSITVADVRTESIALRTSDGGIRCIGIAASRLECRTSDGSVHIECAADAPNAIAATVTTSDGGITFAAPPGLSAVVEASTNDGSIQTALPITIEGKVGKSLRGTIGDGEGRLILKTHDGSITIR